MNLNYEPDADALLASDTELDDDNQCDACGARSDQDCSADCTCEDCEYRSRKEPVRRPSYDDRQLAAVLARCGTCARWFYMTQPAERCVACR